MAAAGKILVTGAGGFVGSHLAARLEREGFDWFGQVRPGAQQGARLFAADLVQAVDWRPRLAGVRTVVHLAALAHARHPDPALNRRVNVDAASALARQCAGAGVGRFVFVSSVAAQAAATPYGRAKRDAEKAILDAAARSAMRVLILRPCLMYGAGARGNLAAMLRWLEFGLPLPLAGVDNRRSLTHVGNFCDLLLRCLDAGDSLAGTYAAVDGGVFSTPELLRRVALGMGTRARLFRCPKGLLAAALRLAGAAEKLLDDLVIDGRELMAKLSWSPPFAAADGFREMGEAWLRRGGGVAGP